MKKRRFKKMKVVVGIVCFSLMAYGACQLAYSGGEYLGFKLNLPKNIPKVTEIAAQEIDDSKYTKEIEELKQQIKYQQTVSSELKQKLNEYNEREANEKAKEKQLYEIVNTKLTEVGRTIVVEGSENYLGTYKDGKWLTERNLGYNISYKFGISCDFQNGELVGFVKGNPIIKLPKSSIDIEYVEVLNDSLEFPKQEKDVSLFASEFNENDTKEILLMAKKNIEKLIHSNREYFDKGEVGTEKYLKDMGSKYFKYDDMIVKFY